LGEASQPACLVDHISKKLSKLMKRGTNVVKAFTVVNYVCKKWAAVATSCTYFSQVLSTQAIPFEIES
jgi:hypothetical protein